MWKAKKSKKKLQFSREKNKGKQQDVKYLQKAIEELQERSEGRARKLESK